MKESRRSFLANAAYSAAALALSSRTSAQTHDMSHMQHNEPEQERPAIPRLPAILSKVTGTLGIDAAYKILFSGSDTLDAALHVCKTQEDDPKDHSTGLGALPNSQREVELDACCLHGPTHRAAAVGSVSGIRNVSLLARALMENTGNTLLVGPNAQAFALAHGFAKEDLLTGYTRQNYALWNRMRSDPGILEAAKFDPTWPDHLYKAHAMPNSQKEFDLLVHKCEPLALEEGIAPALTWRAAFDVIAPRSQAVYVSTVDRKGQLSSASSSGGQPWRRPGIASDVAAIGAGCFLDPAVGSAGASGNAEASIKIAGAHTIVENMRRGMSPELAGMDALRRIVRWYNNDINALRFVEVVYYILRTDGAYSGVSLWSGDSTGHVRQYTIKDAENARRTEDCVALFPCGPLSNCAIARG